MLCAFHMNQTDTDFKVLIEMVQLLSSDVKAASALSRDNDSQFIRRAYIRSVFSMIEGNIFQMKAIILKAFEDGRITLSLAEQALLREESYELANNGACKVQQKFIHLQQNIKFTLALFARMYGELFEPDTSAHGWDSFNTAIKIRNRITHPKSPGEFNIMDNEIPIIEEAIAWFADNMEKLLDKC